MSEAPKIGLALGGGGARGFAHVPALETFDACGVTPTVIAGTSMGALIGALYASGKSGSEIRTIVEEHSLASSDGWKQIFAKRGVLFRWLRALRPSWTGSGLLRADDHVRFLLEQMGAEHFDDLEIPLRVVTTDFHSGESFVFESGPLRPALEASMSVPGVFVPVEHEGRLLVDGGVSDNLPYGLLTECCDLTVAVDVVPARVGDRAEDMSALDATLAMFDILVERSTRLAIEAHPPSVYVHPPLDGIRILDFERYREVFDAAAPAMVELRDRLREARSEGRPS